MKVLFSSRECHFSLRWIRGILAIRRRACVSLRRDLSGSWACDTLALSIEDRIICNSLPHKLTSPSPENSPPTEVRRSTTPSRERYAPILVAAPTYIGQHTNLYRSSQQPLYLRQPHPDEVTRSAQNPAPYPIETRTFVVRGYCNYRQANPPSRSLHPAYPLCQSKGSDLDNHHNTK